MGFLTVRASGCLLCLLLELLLMLACHVQLRHRSFSFNLILFFIFDCYLLDCLRINLTVLFLFRGSVFEGGRILVQFWFTLALLRMLSKCLRKTQRIFFTRKRWLISLMNINWTINPKIDKLAKKGYFPFSSKIKSNYSVTNKYASDNCLRSLKGDSLKHMSSIVQKQP